MNGIPFIVDTALAEVPVNVAALVDDTDFKTKEESVAYDAAGMDLVWNFVTPAGAMTQTAVTPTTGGDYDWANQGNGMYSIEIPASAGASINNDTEGYGWFTGVATGVLPWRGPVCAFLPANVVNSLVSGTDYLQVDIQSLLGVEYGFTGQIQAMTADTPVAGVQRITIQDPGLDEDAANQINGSTFFLVDRSQQKVIGAASIGDYDFSNLYVFVDNMDITPTTGMDYLIVFSPKAALLSGGDLDVAALNQIVTDWINGGRLDLLLDAIKAVTDALPDAGALTTIGADTARLTAARAQVLTDWVNGGRLDLLLDAIPTTAMRGTDNAATEAKQDALIATVGVAGAGLTATAQASVCTEGRLAELDAANLPADVDTLLGRITATLFSGITSLAEWLGLIAGKQTGDATAVTEIKATGAGSGTYDPTTDSVEAIRDHIGDGTNLTEAGGTGDQLTDLGGMSTGMKAEVNAEADTALSDYAPNTTTPPTAAAISDQVWEEAIADHSGTVGSTAEQLAAAGASGDPWSTALPGSYGAGTAGKILDTIAGDVENLDGEAMRGTNNAATEVKQDIIDTVVDSLVLAVAALNNISAADVNAELVDVLTVDTLDELAQGLPPANPTFAQGLILLYMLLRNKATVTATELGIHNDAGVKIAKKVLADDGTTYTESEMISGA